MKPGVTVRPRPSTTSVLAPLSFEISSSLPTARICWPRMAIAVADAVSESMVSKFAPLMIRSAGPVASRVAADALPGITPSDAAAAAEPRKRLRENPVIVVSLGVGLRAQLVDRINQHTQVFGVDVGCNNMSKDKNVPWSLTVALGRVRHSLANDRGWPPPRCSRTLKRSS